MIQRIQSVYLLLATIALVVCCCLPLATFTTEGMGLPSVLRNLFLLDAQGHILSWIPVVLLALITLAVAVTVFAIFGYKNRKSQMTTCLMAMGFEVLWMVAYTVICKFECPGTEWHPAIGGALPIVALILTWLARRAIWADEKLVRSADRIR